MNIQDGFIGQCSLGRVTGYKSTGTDVDLIWIKYYLIYMTGTGCSEIHHDYQLISFEYLLSFVLGCDEL